MKYTVCYAVYCSTQIEANSPEEAAKKAGADYRTWHEESDLVDVTMVQDEEGNEFYI